MDGAPGFFTTLARVCRRDAALEWRSPAGFMSALLFAATLSVVYHYAMAPGVFDNPRNLRGIMLATLFFAASLSAARNAAAEAEADALRAALLAPADPSGYFLGKTLALWTLQLALIAVYIPLYQWLLAGRLTDEPRLYLALFVILGLAALSLAALGVMLAYIARGNRMRELLFPLLLLPAALPVLILAADALEDIQAAADFSLSLRAIIALLAPAGLYCGLGALLYSALAAEE